MRPITSCVGLPCFGLAAPSRLSQSDPRIPPPPPRTGLQIPPQPTTVRGAPLHLNRHPKQPSRVVYASGKYIVVRDLQVNKQ